ncbi:hypothetical protein EYF80_065687 [Liparis tanakae]|uniref:Uncharacterized protein n=1 Tax=Liparis tanakae TaxID=230148 RepID=A0A4Z2E790_9TELE|nr:hypothetical protein EYF80_065687 [Liparis tanakae]
MNGSRLDVRKNDNLLLLPPMRTGAEEGALRDWAQEEEALGGWAEKERALGSTGTAKGDEEL